MTEILKSGSIRIILHVGHGLEHFTVGKPQSEALEHLRSMMRPVAQRLSTATRFEEMAIPELMVSTSSALLAVALRFRGTVEDDTAVLSVATFSQNVVAELLNIVVDAGFGDTLRICLYPNGADGSYTVHQLDKEGFLGADWPYGVLHPKVDEDALHALDFRSIKSPQPATTPA